MSEIVIASRLRFDPSDVRLEFMPEGGTLAEIVARQVFGATADQIARLRVTLVTAKGEWLIARENWRKIKPKAGTTVRIQAVVGKGNVLRTILSIAVLAASLIFLGPASPLAVGLAGTLGVTAATASAGLVAAASIAGSLLINALVPIGGTDDSKPDTTYSIQGTRNQVNPWGPVPVVLGKHRIYPPHASGQYSEVVGDNIHLRALLLVSRGRVRFSDPRLGETPLESFNDTESEFREGQVGDAPVTLYEETTFEDSYNAVLKYVDAPTVRRTATATDAVSIDIGFNALLATDDDDGDKHPVLVGVDVAYRKMNETGGPHGDWIPTSGFVVIEQKQEPFRRTMRIEFEEPGLYEVRLHRSVVDQDGNDSVIDEVSWAVMRSIRHAYPIDCPDPLALVALRIKASKQLNGTIDELNLIGELYIPDWDAGTETWITRPTSNPASIYRYVLQGGATAFPREDSEIDLEALAEWHTWCDGRGLKYNRYHDFDQSARDTLAQVAAAGRATISQVGGKYSVVIDRPQTILRGHITQRNAFGFSGEMSYIEPPDAWRVRFLDEADNWRAREIVVPRPGLDGDPVIYEQTEYLGYTTYELNYREGLRRFAELELRPETFYCMQDFEHLFAPRGSLVLYQNPILSEAMVAARIKEIGTLQDGTGRTYVVIDDVVTMADDEEYVCRFRLSSGASTLFVVETAEGETDTLILGSRLSGSGTPARGDLAMFGLRDFETIECVVKAIEPMKNLAARLTLVRHAPEIQALADDVEIPPIVHDPSDPPWLPRAPEEPVIYSVRSGPDEIIAGSTGSPVIVRVRPGAGSVPVSEYVVTAQRGAEAPIDITVPASSGRAVFDDFDIGAVISITAVAVSFYAEESDPCDPVSHTVKARTDLPANPVTLNYSALSDGQRHFTWTVDPSATTAQKSRVRGFEVRSKPGSGWDWDDLDPMHDGTSRLSPLDTEDPLTSGPHTIGVASYDSRGRYCQIPKVRDFTLGISAGSARGRLDFSNPAQSGLLGLI